MDAMPCRVLVGWLVGVFLGFVARYMWFGVQQSGCCGCVRTRHLPEAVTPTRSFDDALRLPNLHALAGDQAEANGEAVGAARNCCSPRIWGRIERHLLDHTEYPLTLDLKKITLI